MESMIDHLAKSIGGDVEAVRKMNLYKQGQVEYIMHRFLNHTLILFAIGDTNKDRVAVL